CLSKVSFSSRLVSRLAICSNRMTSRMYSATNFKASTSREGASLKSLPLVGCGFKGGNGRQPELAAVAASVFVPIARHPVAPPYVRFRGQSGHAFLHCICPLMTQSGQTAANSDVTLVQRVEIKAT